MGTSFRSPQRARGPLGSMSGMPQGCEKEYSKHPGLLSLHHGEGSRPTELLTGAGGVHERIARGCSSWQIS